MDIKDFLSFRRMVSPIIIKVVFWIGVGISIITGIVSIIGGLLAVFSEGGIFYLITGVISGFLIIILGVLAVRIYSELLILAFQINESLTDIKKLMEKLVDRE